MTLQTVPAAAPVRRPGLSRLRSGGGCLLFRCCLGIAALVVAVALAAPWLAPLDPNSVDFGAALSGPGADHLLGGDISGRDTLSRLIHGARTSLLGPLGVVAFSTLLGLVIGVAAAWRGGWLDTALSRSSELLLAFPGLLLAMLFVALYGQGLFAPVVALSLAYTPSSAASPAAWPSPNGSGPIWRRTGCRASPARGSACATWCPTSCPSYSPSRRSTSATPCSIWPPCRSWAWAYRR